MFENKKCDNNKLAKTTEDSVYDAKPSMWEIRATISERYCTKEESREVKKDVDRRISDIWKVIIGIVVPIVIAIVGLTIAIFTNKAG